MSEKATIKSWFIENHLDIDSNKLDKLMTYLEMIRDASKRMNLVSKNDLPHIIGRHFLDSLFALTVFEFPPQVKVADIGSGAGFPGIPLAIAQPNIEMALVESRRLKALFLKSVCDKLGLKNCAVIHDRWENIGTTFDVILVRAVFRESALKAAAMPHLNPGGAILYYRKYNDIKILRKCFT